MIFDYLKSGYVKLKSALNRTSALLGTKIKTLFSGKLDEETLSQLERLLYEADLGVQTATELTTKVRLFHKQHPSASPEELLEQIKREILLILSEQSPLLTEIPKTENPLVILIIGVNGNGKTTSVAKLANRLQSDGKKVLIAAADTFRAAAIEQLEIWAKRLGTEIVKGAYKSDPAAVAFDAVTAGKARQSDVVIIDTAGRLHTKTDLMQELEKIKRVCKKVSTQAPHEVLLVLDATTGQNAIDQAKTFHRFTPITGLILSKLDGTAKGGIVVSIQRELKIPVKFIGTGEGLEDLEPFNAEKFTQLLFD